MPYTNEPCPMTAEEEKYFQAIALEIQQIFGVAARNPIDYSPAHNFALSPSDSLPARAQITFDFPVTQKLNAILIAKIDFGGEENIQIELMRTGKNDARIETLLRVKLRSDNLAMGKQMLDIYLADYQAIASKAKTRRKRRADVIQFPSKIS